MLHDDVLATGLELETVTASASLEGLARDWHRLWARSPGATPFQSPEWLVPWWHTFGTGTLLTLAFRLRGRLVGLVPFYIAACNDGSGRVVRLLGSGNSDYLDALAQPGMEDAVVALAFRYLDTRHDQWNRCDLLELRQESPLLRAPAPAGWGDEILPNGTCPFVRIDHRDFESALPAGFLPRLRYGWRCAHRQGSIRVSLADSAGLDNALGTLFRLHGMRWRARGEAGMLADSTVQSFHRAAARGLLRRGMLRLYTLCIDERAAASTYVLHHRERAFYYLTAFDPAFRKLSPGRLLLHHALREAARQGIRIFDLLRGQEAYKQQWSTSARENRMRRFHPRAAGRSASHGGDRPASTRTASP